MGFATGTGIDFQLRKSSGLKASMSSESERRCQKLRTNRHKTGTDWDRETVAGVEGG